MRVPMSTQDAAERDLQILYQADEKPPAGLTLGLGLQLAFLSLGGILLPPMIVYRVAGATDAVLTWAVFASLLVAGAVTALHAFPIRRFGAGYFLVSGTTAAAIAVSVDALAAGGPALLFCLMLAAALFQFLFSFRISIFRRILTPAVSGTVLMLIPMTIAPIVFGRIADVPAGHSQSSGLACALATLAPIVLLVFKGGRWLRPWAPLIGIGAGTAVAGAYGLYDVDRIAQAPWVGFPPAAWPVFAIDFGPSFWGLLPAFLLVTLTSTIRSMSASMSIQYVSWRTQRATDLRSVQGAVAADAAANLLAALGGTLLQATRSSTVSFAQITRVSARRVGLAVGAALVIFAFLPKFTALVLALPGAVLSTYVMVIIAMRFVVGMRMVVSDGLDHRQALVVGLSFWIGVGCQFGLLAPEYLSWFAGGLFTSGLAAGGVTAILLTILLELAGARRPRLETDLDMSSMPRVCGFVRHFASEHGWALPMVERLEAVVEETLLTLVEEEAAVGARRRRLRVTAYRDGSEAVLEFVAKLGDSNIEDRVAFLEEAHPVERDISLRLLRHLASEVRHRQYHDLDVVTVRVQNPGDTQKK